MPLLKDYKVIRKILDYLGIYEFKRDRPPPRVLAIADTFEEILACIYFQITEAKPLYLAKLWLESTYFSIKTDLGSQGVSELLEELGEDEEKRLSFLVFIIWPEWMVYIFCFHYSAAEKLQQNF